MHPSASFPKPIPVPVEVSWLVERIEQKPLEIKGDANLVVGSVAIPSEARNDSLVFYRLKGPDALADIQNCSARAMAITIDAPEQAGRCLIRLTDPRKWYISALKLMFPSPPTTIDPTARIAGTCSIDEDVHVGAYSVLEDGARIGARTRIGAHVVIGAGCEIGRDCVVQSGTVVGGTGVIYYWDEKENWYDFPHLGKVIIEDRVEIGTNSVIVRGILSDTVIGTGSKLGNFVNIGHNTKIAPHCWITSRALLCGEVTLGKRAMIAAGACVRNSAVIGERAVVGMGTLVTKNVPAGVTVFGVPGRPLRTMRPLAAETMR